MRDPEAEAKRFRMFALAIFIFFMVFIYILFDYMAQQGGSKRSGLPPHLRHNGGDI